MHVVSMFTIMRGVSPVKFVWNKILPLDENGTTSLFECPET